LTSGGRLTAQECARLHSSRELFASYWVSLERHLRQGKAEVETLPYLRSLSARTGCAEGFLRADLAIEVFAERGLISVQKKQDTMVLCLNQTQGKVDLFACPYLTRLRDANR
jgi:single-stranded-DNA-specific exonuclease